MELVVILFHVCAPRQFAKSAAKPVAKLEAKSVPTSIPAGFFFFFFFFSGTVSVS